MTVLNNISLQFILIPLILVSMNKNGLKLALILAKYYVEMAGVQVGIQPLEYSASRIPANTTCNVNIKLLHFRKSKSHFNGPSHINQVQKIYRSFTIEHMYKELHKKFNACTVL